MAGGTAKAIPPPPRGVTPARLSRPLPRNSGASFVTMGRRKLRSPWTRSLLKESTNDLSARQQRRGVEMTMRQLYNENAFLARVNFAEKCFRDHLTHTRAMDTCFEMYDGAAVVVAARPRPICRHRQRLERQIPGGMARPRNEIFPYPDRAACQSCSRATCDSQGARRGAAFIAGAGLIQAEHSETLQRPAGDVI